MKFLLVFAVVMVAFYVWRSQRRPGPPGPGPGNDRQRQANALPTQDMVQCPACSVHLPRGEALPGKRGLYCSDEHRLRVEG